MKSQKDLSEILKQVLEKEKHNISQESVIKLNEVIEKLTSQKLTTAEMLEILFVIGRFATEVAPDIWQHFSP